MEVATVDPSSPRFMYVDQDTETAVKNAVEAERVKESQEGERVSM